MGDDWLTVIGTHQLDRDLDVVMENPDPFLMGDSNKSEAIRYSRNVFACAACNDHIDGDNEPARQIAVVNNRYSESYQSETSFVGSRCADLIESSALRRGRLANG